MRVLFAWAVGLSLCAGLLIAAEPALKKPKGGQKVASDSAGGEKNEKERTLKKASYMFGMDVARSLQAKGLDLNSDAFIKGFLAELAGKAPKLSDEKRNEVMLAIKPLMEERLVEMAKAAGARAKQEGDAYLAENKNKKGVNTTKSGLQYQVLKSGEGKSPKTTDTVTMHYQGTLVDGTLLDSTYKLGQPASLPVNGMLPGWIEALQLMKVGDKWRIVVPASLAFGAEGQKNSNTGAHTIPPDATLIFELELLGIKGAE